MRTIVVLTASLWILGTATGAAQERHRPVSGAVKEVDPVARTLTLADGEYYVPPGTYELKGVKPGDPVVLQWEERGNRRVVLQLTHSSVGD